MSTNKLDFRKYSRIIIQLAVILVGLWCNFRKRALSNILGELTDDRANYNSLPMSKNQKSPSKSLGIRKVVEWLQ